MRSKISTRILSETTQETIDKVNEYSDGLILRNRSMKQQNQDKSITNNKGLYITFKFGFKYKGFNYGWKDGDLYRLPSVKNNRNYHFKKLPQITVGNNLGYRVVRDKKTIEQLKELTQKINYTYIINGHNSKDTPF